MELHVVSNSHDTNACLCSLMMFEIFCDHFLSLQWIHGVISIYLSVRFYWYMLLRIAARP